MSYSVDVCDCGNVGSSIETLASTSYEDETTSLNAYPTLPASIVVQVVDSTRLCGVPDVKLGERVYAVLISYFNVRRLSCHACYGCCTW